MKKASVVDIFCGIGGLSHGFVLENFEVIAGVDSDVSCQYAYETNNDAKFIGKKLEDMAPEEVASLYPKDHLKILVGCAPCQPFSSVNVKRPENDKWKLVNTFAELIEKIQPEIFSMENVMQLRTFQKGEIFEKFIRRLEESGYTVSWYAANSLEYGVPQARRRLVVFGSKFGRIQMAPPTNSLSTPKTVRQAIGKLKEISAGGRSAKDPLHRSTNLTEINKRRILASIPGGTWSDWSSDLVLSCHKRPRSETKGATARSAYGRMEWDKPAPTLTTNFYNLGSGRYGHPEQTRALSLREGALIQTFPKEYKFVQSEKEINFNKIGRQIGNAVPVELGRAIARSISSHISGLPSGEPTHERQKI